MAGAPKAPVSAAPTPARVTRAAVDVAVPGSAPRTVSYRTAGTGAPVLVIGSLEHSSAAPAHQFLPLARRGQVIAFDAPGSGLSEPLDEPSITALAELYLTALTVLGVERCPLVACGTGAAVAVQCALTAPGAVTGLILDDALLLSTADRAALAPRLTAPVAVSADGAHLVAHWSRGRDELTFFPWFERSDAAYLHRDLSDQAAVETLHARVLDALDAGDRHCDWTRAALRYDVEAALRQVAVPVAWLPPAHPRRCSIEMAPAVVALDATCDAERLGHIASFVEAHQGASAAPCGAHRDAYRGDGLRARFVTTPWGQLACRVAAPPTSPQGDQVAAPRPLVMLHSSPGSGEALLPRARALARLRPVVVLDTLGNGDSDKPDAGRHPQFRAPQIADYARVVLAALDDLGLGQVDVYGTHTGALIALEAALHDEGRVRAVLLDGISLFTAAEVESAMSLQFVDLTPRWDGTHLLAAWSLVRDSRFWYPWYIRDEAHRASRGYADTGALHRSLVQLAKSGTTYSLSYRAAFLHPTRERLAGLRQRAAFLVRPGDPLAASTSQARSLVAGADEIELSNDEDRDALLLDRWLGGGPVSG